MKPRVAHPSPSTAPLRVVHLNLLKPLNPPRINLRNPKAALSKPRAHQILNPSNYLITSSLDNNRASRANIHNRVKVHRANRVSSLDRTSRRWLHRRLK